MLHMQGRLICGTSPDTANSSKERVGRETAQGKVN